MKDNILVILIAAAVALGVNSAQAQNADASRVKLLPTATPGIIKLHYALESNAPLDITFLAEDQIVQSDRIKGNFPNGLSKRYDLRKLKGRDVKMVISSDDMSLTYDITVHGDKKKFTAFLEKTVYNNQPMVKANN